MFAYDRAGIEVEGKFCRRSVLIFEPAVDGLDIGEDALPIRFAHRHHIFHIQQGIYARLLIGNFEGERKIVSSSLRRQF